MPSHRVLVGPSAVVSIFLLMTSYVWAVEIHLAWDAPTTADATPPQGLTGYKLYYGRTSRLYDFVIDVGNRTTYTLSGLKAGQQYYFSVVAYDHSLDESPLSEEVSTITAAGPAAEDTDSDGDGLLDADEMAIYGTDPFAADTDGDGLEDAYEVSFWADAWDTDYDGDGDGVINLLDFDTDNDGFSDGFEYRQSSDPSDSTSTPTPASSSWTNYWVTLTMRSEGDGATGVMFRYQDPDNYYRFSSHSDGGHGRLIKRHNGAFTLLAESAIPFVPALPYQVDIVADGMTLEVSIDNTPIFSVVDSALSQGSIGLYAWFNEESSFDDILVEDLDTEEVLAWDDFENGNFTSWAVVDEGTQMAPSAWSVSDGALLQSSKIHSEATDPADIAHYGTYVRYTR
jgi:Bacterial TSP3 repeat/Fibronectin type III domain